MIAKIGKKHLDFTVHRDTQTMHQRRQNMFNIITLTVNILQQIDSVIKQHKLNMIVNATILYLRVKGLSIV